MFRFGRNKRQLKNSSILLGTLISAASVGGFLYSSKSQQHLEKFIETSNLLVEAFSVDDLPSADYTTFPFRSQVWRVPSRNEQLEQIEKLDSQKDEEESILDLCIVGDGLIGASMAYEAALRGYSVCLLSPNDFVSHRDEFTLNSNMIFHNVLDGDEFNGIVPNFFSTQVMTCEGGFSNDKIECKLLSNLYKSMKDKIEKRNNLFLIAPHLMREYRNTEIFRNSQKFNYYKQMWKLLGFENFIYGKDLWMEDIILDDRNYCEARLGVLRNKFQERTKDQGDIFRDLKDSRNVFRCITYFDSGILNMSRFVTSLALTSAAVGNFSLNHIKINNVDLKGSTLVFSDKNIENGKGYTVKYKKLVFCENSSEDDSLLQRLNPSKCKEEFLYTLPLLSNYNIITQYGKFISHYRYSLLSLPSQHVERLRGILRLGDFTTKDIYSSSKYLYDNELKLIKLEENPNALRIIDRTKDYYSAHAALKYIYGKELKEMKSIEPIYGSENFVHFLTQTMKSKYPYLPDDIIRYLKFSYGDRCLGVLSEGAIQPQTDKATIYLHKQLWDDLPFIESEIKYLINKESCIKALDVVIRCQMYKYDPLRIVLESEKLLDIMKDELRWNSSKYLQEKQELVQFLNNYYKSW